MRLDELRIGQAVRLSGGRVGVVRSVDEEEGTVGVDVRHDDAPMEPVDVHPADLSPYSLNAAAGG